MAFVYLCPHCDNSDEGYHQHLWHVRKVHRDFNVLYFDCRYCDARDMGYEWYRRHIKKCKNAQLQILNDIDMEAEDDNENRNDDFDFDDGIGALSENDNSAIEEIDNITGIEAVMSKLKIMYDDLWLSMLSTPDITKKTVNMVCNRVHDMLKKSLEVLRNDNDNYMEATDIFSKKWSKSTSQYLRHKELYASGDFIEPEKQLTSERLEPISGYDHLRIANKFDYMAYIPIKKTLKSVLNSPGILSALVMPSTFASSTSYNHCFSGIRSKEILEVR